MKKDEWSKLLPEDRAVRQYIYSLGDRTDEGYDLITALVRSVRLDEQLRNQCGCDVCAKEAALAEVSK